MNSHFSHALFSFSEKENEQICDECDVLKTEVKNIPPGGIRIIF